EKGIKAARSLWPKSLSLKRKSVRAKIGFYARSLV
ncbi:MAG: hypothetical protein ACI9FJ_000264, partial [Alteromonadaceae bacterium]